VLLTSSHSVYNYKLVLDLDFAKEVLGLRR